jgi:N-methylhydantoinase B
LRKDVWDLIFANIVLTMVQEDIKAQVGACTLGERKAEGAGREIWCGVL